MAHDDDPQAEYAVNYSPDRGDTAVARQPNGKTYAIIGLIVIIAGLLMAVIAGGGGNKATKKAEEETFAVSGAQSKPYIEPEKVTKKPKAEKPRPQPQPMYSQERKNNDLLQREAIRMAREKKQAQEQRLQSPQLIYSEMGQSSGEQLAQTEQGSLTGNDDKYDSFANKHGNDVGEVKKATELSDPTNMVSQGTMISGVLETPIASNLPGYVRAIVADDVYSFNGQRKLIPAGSTVIGRYSAATTQGQSRVFVIWQRLLRPDGVSMVLDSYGTDALGRTGLQGEVDTHFFERFGGSIMLSLIDGATMVGANAVNNDNGQNVALQTGQDVNRAAEIALENSINIPPTIYIDQGSRINIFVRHDLDFSDATKEMVQVH